MKRLLESSNIFISPSLEEYKKIKINDTIFLMLECKFQNCDKLFLNKLRLDKHMQTHIQTHIQFGDINIEELLTNKQQLDVAKIIAFNLDKSTSQIPEMLENKIPERVPVYIMPDMMETKQVSEKNTKKPFEYKCAICNKILSCKMSLNRHIITHKREVPSFICDVCGEIFSRKSNLINHTTIHTGKKLFICEICGQLFVHKCRFDAHRRVHTGEKQFECEICKKKFDTKGHLNRHILIHNKNKLKI